MIVCLLMLAVATSVVVAQLNEPFQGFSELLEKPFSCDTCWTAPGVPNPSTTSWCLCCFYDCGGFRADCMRDGFCQHDQRCKQLDICTEYGGIPPEGAEPGNPASFYEADGTTLKRSDGSPPTTALDVPVPPSPTPPPIGIESFKCKEGYVPRFIDFADANAAGGSLALQGVQEIFGDCVTDVWLWSKCYGGKINGKQKQQSKIFFYDSESPGLLAELGSPNENCNGDFGEGECGKALGALPNCHPLGNVMYVSAAGEAGELCTKNTDVGIKFKHPVYIKVAGVLNAKVDDDNGSNMRDVAQLAGHLGTDQQFKKPFPDGCNGDENGLAVLEITDYKAVDQVKFWYKDDLAIAFLGFCQPEPDPLVCDPAWWHCPKDAKQACVHDRCETLSAADGGIAGSGHSANFADVPCSSDSDTPCVCEGYPSVKCERKTPKPTAVPCKNDLDCFEATGKCNQKCHKYECVKGEDNPYLCPASKGCGKRTCEYGECGFEADPSGCPDLNPSDCKEPECVAHKSGDFVCEDQDVPDHTDCLGVGYCDGQCKKGECVCPTTTSKTTTTKPTTTTSTTTTTKPTTTTSTTTTTKPTTTSTTTVTKPTTTTTTTTTKPSTTTSTTRTSTTMMSTTTSTPMPTPELVLGACCQADGVCTDVSSEERCDVLDGEWMPEEECANEPCIACEAQQQCGERPGCYGGLNDGLLCRTLDDCIGGHRCVPLEESCQEDAPCQDCNDDEDDMRAHQCSPCAFCEPEVDGYGRERMPERGALDLPCCPFEEEKRMAALLTPEGVPEFDNPATILPDPKKASVFFKLGLNPVTKECCIEATAKNIPVTAGVGLFTGNLAGEKVAWPDTSQPLTSCLVFDDDDDTFDLFLEAATQKTLGGIVLYQRPEIDEEVLFAVAAPLEHVQEAPLKKKARGGRKSKCNKGEEPDAQGNCRPRLGCSCQNCEDMCDFELEEEAQLGSSVSGIPLDQRSQLSGFITPDFQCTEEQEEKVDQGTCEALLDASCRLRSSSPIRGTIEPTRVPDTEPDFCGGRLAYQRKETDVYRIYAPERTVNITLEAVTGFLSGDKELEAVYLIDANDWCKHPTVISPVDSEPGLGLTQPTAKSFIFELPCPGDYIVVYNLLEENFVPVFPSGFRPVTDEERREMRCRDYKISFSSTAPQCPSDLCEIGNFCHGARDCANPSHSCFACASQYGRCILSPPFHDHHRADPHRRYENSLPSSKYHNAWPSEDDDASGYGDDDSDGKPDWWKKWERDRQKGDDYENGDDKRRNKHAVPVCWGADAGTLCIGVVKPEERGKHAKPKCFIGACRGEGDEECARVNEDVFDCDCRCKSLCANDMECEDGDPHTFNKCDLESGVCIERELESLWRCDSFTNVPLAKQPIIEDCESEELEVHGECVATNGNDNGPVAAGYKDDGDVSDFGCFYKAYPRGDKKDVEAEDRECEPVDECTRAAQQCKCRAPLEPPACTREVYGRKVAFTCTNNTETEPPTPSPAPASTRTYNPQPSADPVTVECAAKALDDAELAHTATAFDVYGAYINGARQQPVCSGDFEQQQIEVDSDKHASSLSECCSTVDVEHKCLDGAQRQSAAGHQWLDRAWHRLDEATQEAEQRQALTSLEHSCCAQLYYTALADWCGRRGADADYWKLSGATVRRAGDGVGDECAAFDDGHRDRDLNDWVVRQRTVEVVQDGTVRAINVHVTPLARGGGYRASYALSLRGTHIQSIDHGANAACSERSRALMHEAYDPTAMANALRQRQDLPEGSTVVVLRHANGDEALPVGVRDSGCATLGGSAVGSYCRAQEAGDVALFDDVRRALPSLHGDALDALLSSGVRVDQSTNTRRNTHSVRARYGASAVIDLAPGAATASGASVRFVLRNEDCGAAVLLPTRAEQLAEASHPSPLAVRVPPHSCAAFRWAAEGVQLVQRPDSQDRVCRGGTLGGIAECGAAAENTCTSGGECAAAPSDEGVPYSSAYTHFACERCATDAACRTRECAGHRCCTEHVLHWYRYPTTELVYQPQPALDIDVLLAANNGGDESRFSAAAKGGKPKPTPAPSPAPAPTPAVDFDVALGGYGYAAVSASNQFQSLGLSFVALEASNHVGGRMKSKQVGVVKDENDDIIGEIRGEAGANWVQGLNGNPVWCEAIKYGLGGNAQNFDDVEFYDKDGVNQPREALYLPGSACLRADEAFVAAGEFSARCVIPGSADRLKSVDKRYCEGILGAPFAYSDDDDYSQEEAQQLAAGFLVANDPEPQSARTCEQYSLDYEFAQQPSATSVNYTLPIATYSFFRDADYWTNGTYERLPQRLAAEFLNATVNADGSVTFGVDPRLQLQTKVLEVHWGGLTGTAPIETLVCDTVKLEQQDAPTTWPCVPGSERTITSTAFLSTFSIGVLQRSIQEELNGVPLGGSRDVAPRFDPPLASIPAGTNGFSNTFASAVQEYGMACYGKIFTQWSKKFWGDTQMTLSAYSAGPYQGDYAPTWQSLDAGGNPNRFVPGSQIFFVTVASDRCVDLQQKTDAQVIAEILPVVNQMFNTSIHELYGRPVEAGDLDYFSMTRWLTDPLAYGMYTNHRTDQSWDEKEPSRQCYGKLCFSGEHSCFTVNGYTHAALMGGKRSALIMAANLFGQTGVDAEQSICDVGPTENDPCNNGYVPPGQLRKRQVANGGKGNDHNPPGHVVHSRGYPRDTQLTDAEIAEQFAAYQQQK